MDLYSIKMIHWEVHDIQSAEIATKFIEKVVEKVGFIKVDNTLIRADGRNTDIFCNVLELHSDNRAPMRGSTIVAKCLDLGIPCTYNRPRHSNDNAHMEASFRLLDTVMRLLFLKALTPYLKQELGVLNTMICITTFTVTVASAISLHQNALMVKVM